MSKQVIGKKLKLMDVPVATGEVQQLVITPEGYVLKKEFTNTEVEEYVFMFRVGKAQPPNPGPNPAEPVLIYEHYHTVGLTAQDVTHLLSNPGQTDVQKRSNTVNEHFHDVTFYYDAGTNTFVASNITSASDIEHSAQLIAINAPNQLIGWTGSFSISPETTLTYNNGILTDVTSI
ncbi:hypothetical protein [Flavobacterium sp. GNP002]